MNKIESPRFFTFLLFIVIFLFLYTKLCYSESDPLFLQQQAIQRIDKFIDNFRKTGDRVSLLPELQQAESDLAASYTAFIQSGNLSAAALSLIKSGDIHRMQNRWHQAIDLYQQAYELAKKAGHSPYMVKALMGQVRVHIYGLRDYGTAATLIEEAVHLSSMIQDKSYLFDALDYKAQVQISRGDLIAAADTLNRAFSVAAEIDDQVLLFYGYLDRAEVYQKIATKCDYQRSFEPCYEALELSKSDYESALTIAGKLGYNGLATQTEGFLKRLEMRRALIQSQERFHKQLIEQGIFHPTKPAHVLVQEKFIAGSQHMPAELMGFIRQAGGFAGTEDARSLYIQGLFHEMQGENDAALASYIKAADLLEVDRRNLRDEKSRGTFLEDKIEFYYTPILHLLERNRFSEAFELLERSRSRAMADLLTSKKIAFSGRGEQNIYAQSLKIKTDIALLQKELFDYRSRPDRGKYENEINLREKKIKKLEEEYQETLKRTTREAPRLQELIVSKPVSLQKLQLSLKQERFEIIAYMVLESQVILWHISSDEVHVRSIFLPRSELIKKVAGLRKSLTDKNIKFDEQTSREMFLFLIQPAMQWINTSHLVIIPHEDLNYIPFQVFQNPSDQRYLGESFEISYAPNATILMDLQKTGSIAKGRLLAVADPDIIEAIDEVETIARLYPNRNKVVNEFLVKETDLKQWAGHYDLLHFSVHGKFRPEEPLLSYLQLKKGGKDDGMLTAAEIFGLPLEKTDLVVLSACETGIAEATHANEILGMTRALLYAGAETLVLSFWKVDSASTALWMETFYREGQRKPLGEAARLALKEVKKHPDYKHPYYWGPFMMVGK